MYGGVQSKHGSKTGGYFECKIADQTQVKALAAKAEAKEHEVMAFLRAYAPFQEHDRLLTAEKAALDAVHDRMTELQVNTVGVVDVSFFK